MITVKSMDVRDNFKSWCMKAADGEVIQISRPGNNFVYMVNQETYENLSPQRRIFAYMSYLNGKDKITNLKRLSEIEKLPDNWNGNGAEKISNAIVKTVRRLLLCTRHQPEIFPTACDALQLEWDNAAGEYLEMEVLEEHINVFRIDKEGNEEQQEIPIDEIIVNDIVEAFYDRAV